MAPSTIELGHEAGLDVLETIGRGEQAVVYRGVRQGREYAVKVLHRDDDRDPDAIREFIRQTAQLAVVEHPSLPGVRVAGVTPGGSPFVVTDFVEGEALDKRVYRARLTERDALRLGKDLAGALGAAHRINLVHRDVKPENIVMSTDGVAHLLDFGLATEAGDATGDDLPPDMVAGTMAYSPPEQVGMLNRAVDARSDLYSLGAVLYECVTGEPPYGTHDANTLLHLHATAPVPDPRSLAGDLSEVFGEIVRRLLAKDPDDRYQSADGLIADLDRLAVGDGEAFSLGQDDRPVVIGEIPLIGRDRELDRLDRRWRAAAQGQGGLVTIRGTAGSGKTRIATDLAAYAVAQGATVLRGSAPAGDIRPLAAIRGAVDDFLAADDEAAARVRAAAGPAASLLQSFSPAMADLLGGSDLQAGSNVEQFSDAVAGLLTGLAVAGPVLLLLDDVRTFDEATGRVLERLAARIDGVALLVVLTARDEDKLPDGLTDVMEVVLPPLTFEGVGDLLETISPGLRRDAATNSQVALLTGGNPFTVLEYGRAVFDAGLVRPVWDEWVTDEDGMRALALPGDAAQLVMRRTRMLEAEAQHVLGFAAIAGLRFKASLVAEVSATSEPQVLDVLAEAARNGLVEHAGGDLWAFRHDSIQLALANSVNLFERQRRHDLVADVLDRDGDQADVYDLAAHCAAGAPGRDADRLIRVSRLAADRALAEYVPDAALRYLRQAGLVAEMHEISPGPGFDRQMAAVLHRNGRLTEALKSLDKALEETADGIEQAQLYQLIAQVQESLGLGEAIFDSAVKGLAALGRPLPTHPLRLILGTLLMVILGVGIRLTRIGYGTAQGRIRQTYQIETSLYYYGGAGAVRGLRPAYSVLFALRHAYPVNRIGATGEATRSRMSLTLPLRIAKLNMAADRISRRVHRDAARVADPGLSSYVEWVDGISKHAAGVDDGTLLADVLRDRRDSLDTGLTLDGWATIMAEQMLRGECDEGEISAKKRRPALERAGQADRSSSVSTDASLLALRGRAGEAASMIERSTHADAAIHERVDIAIAGLHGAYERNDLGPAFDDLVTLVDGLGKRPIDLMPTQQSYYVWKAYGRIEQARRAPDADRPAALEAAHRAVADLGRAARRPILVAHHRICRAQLLFAEDRPEAALRALAQAEAVLRRVDAPLTAYERALLTARCLAELEVLGEAERQATMALEIARREGWPHRARRVGTEFGLIDRGQQSITQSVGNRRSAALEQVSLAASRILDPARLTQIALDETTRLLGAERALLFLLDGEGVLTPYAGRDAQGKDLRDLTGYSETVVDKVRNTGLPLVLAGTEEGIVLGSRSVFDYGLRSILAVPLQLDERLLGVVYLDSRVAKGVFTVDDVDLLTAVTHHVAVALETARAAQLEVAVAAANRQRDLAETLNAAMARFAAGNDPAGVLRELLTTSLDAAGGTRGWILLRTESGATVLDGKPIAAQPALSALLDLRLPRLGGGTWTPLLTGAPVGSWVVVPLLTREGPAGALVLAAEAAGVWSDADLSVVAALAGQAMAAYDNARLISTDSLTGVANRRHFFELAGAMNGPVTGYMIDIDHFKSVNDNHGHQVGDDVIKGVAARLAGVHPDAVLGRYGGEEFAVLLPGVQDDPIAPGDLLRLAVGTEPMETRNGPLAVTISIGVAWRADGDEPVDALLGRADAGLYLAKEAGRNRVMAHEA